jgi:hypothetical protein
MKGQIGKVTAATLILLGLCIAGVVIFHQPKQLKAEPLDTYHSRWHLVKAVAAEDAADFATTIDLAGAEGDFAHKTANAFRIASFQSGYGRHEGYSPGSKWMFAFCGTDAADETFSFNLVGWAKANGMAQVICEGNGVLGTQDVVIYPGGGTATNAYWADTIELDETTKWPSVAVYNSADNEVAIIVVETTGLEWIDFVTYDVGGGAEAASLGVYGRRY